MSNKSFGMPAWWKVAALTFGGAVLVGACTSGTTASNSATHTPNTHVASPTVTPTVTSPATTPATTPTTPATTPATSPTGTATVSAAACQHVNSLRNSLTSLTHASLNASSASQISADIKNIETQLAALKGQAHGAFATQLNDLNTTVAQVKRAASHLSGVPTASQVQMVVKSLAKLKGRAAGVAADMNQACPPK